MRKTKPLSIQQIFSQVNKLILFLAVIPLLISILLYSKQIIGYQNTITNIQSANNVASKVDNLVLDELWDVVTGQTSIGLDQQHNIAEEIKDDIEDIKKRTNTTEESSLLHVTEQILQTLENYQLTIKSNIKEGNSFEKNTVIMEQVESTTVLLSDILQDFIRVEINIASEKNKNLLNQLIILSVIEFFIICIIIYIIKKNHLFLTKSIQAPIDSLVTMAKELSLGNLGYRVEVPETLEISALSQSFNDMAEHLVAALEENSLKQYHLAQSEARVLQAQITPHFIYNSLDAIIALIEQEKYSEAQKMTFALSNFFRITLSKGKDWITVETEINHIKDYLIILQIRYGKMLQYEINSPKELEKYYMLKMILQPLIENAIYHGTKYIRTPGKVVVSIKEYGEKLLFIIEDNGIGISEDKLKDIQYELSKGVESDFSNGYGLYNVNKRLLLYYGEEANLTIESTYNIGTTVTVMIPKIRRV